MKIPRLFRNVFDTTTVFGRFMDNVFATYASTYLVFIAVAVVWYIFYKTRFGLRLRACGEHPQACETLGINVLAIRFLCVCISGFLSGLGGACVTMAISTQFRPISIVGQGFIAIAAVIFGKFRPHGALLGCLLMFPFQPVFTAERIPPQVEARMRGSSYPEEGTPEIRLEDLRYLRLSYYDFNGVPQTGEMVCNAAIAQDLLEIFRSLYEAQYPIRSIRLVDDFGGSDDASMLADNTSCFNFRPVPGQRHLSRHALGMAVDVNPFENPYLDRAGAGEWSLKE